jgi:4-amino-4-deoxy-L-arabinose transferase-like glycosyltransferase
VEDSQPPSDPLARRLLIVLLVFALVVRVAFSLTRPAGDAALAQLPDQREYLDSARSLLRDQGLGFVDPRFDRRVVAFRTPGYPSFLAACGGNVQIVRLTQAVVDSLSVLAAYLLARRWLERRWALLAGAIVALNPFLIYFSSLLLTETVFTALLAWGMVLITARPPGRISLKWWTGAILLTLSILVRPGALGLPVVLAVSAALMNRRAGEPYHRSWPLPVGTTMLLLTLLTLAPWAYRNHRVLGRWIWTSTNGGFTAYDGFNPDAAAKGWPDAGGSDQSFVDVMPQLRAMTETQRDDYLKAKAAEFVRQNPRSSWQLAWMKIARTWSPIPLSREFSRPLYIAAAAVYAIPFDLLILLGLSSKRLRAGEKLFLLAPALYLTIAAGLSVGSLRYRIPAEVPMAVIAAGAVPVGLRFRRARAGTIGPGST